MRVCVTTQGALNNTELNVALSVFSHQVCVVSWDAEAAGAGCRPGNLTALLLRVSPARESEKVMKFIVSQ